MASSRTPAKRRARAKAASAVNGAVTVTAFLLVEAVNQSEEMRARMERWADELSAINEVLVHELSGRSPSAALERALDRSAELESNIQESAEVVSSINAGLMRGVTAGKKLTRKLLSSDAKRRGLDDLRFTTPSRVCPIECCSMTA
jgi:hypothetical protein